MSGKKMDHVMSVPDYIWRWGQMKSGNTIPTNFLRECLDQVWVADIGPEETETTPPVPDTKTIIEAKWNDLGMGINPLDTDFTEARNAFVEQYSQGDEEKAIKFFEQHTKTGIIDPRRWLMSWWYKNKPRAV